MALADDVQEGRKKTDSGQEIEMKILAVEEEENNFDLIDVDVDVTEIPETTVANDIAIEDKQVQYCPHWMFPARFGRVKVSSVLRGLLIAIMGIAIAIFFILSIIPNSPITALVEDFLTWIESIPLIYQIIAILIFFTASAPLGAPITPINLACGFLFGFFLGLAVALVGSMAGATICFVWGRTLLYSWANSKMEEHRTLQALGIAVQTQAVKLVALTHLSPILPATLLHYTYSAVGVHFSKFSLGTFLGILPFVIVYVYIGSMSRDLTSAIADGDEDSGLGTEIMWMAIIVVVSAIILVAVTWIAKRELNRALEELDRQDEEREAAEEESEEIEEDEENFISALPSQSCPGVSDRELVEDNQKLKRQEFVPFENKKKQKMPTTPPRDVSQDVPEMESIVYDEVELYEDHQENEEESGIVDVDLDLDLLPAVPVHSNVPQVSSKGAHLPEKENYEEKSKEMFPGSVYAPATPDSTGIYSNDIKNINVDMMEEKSEENFDSSSPPSADDVHGNVDDDTMVEIDLYEDTKRNLEEEVVETEIEDFQSTQESISYSAPFAAIQDLGDHPARLAYSIDGFDESDTITETATATDAENLSDDEELSSNFAASSQFAGTDNDFGDFGEEEGEEGKTNDFNDFGDNEPEINNIVLH